MFFKSRSTCKSGYNVLIPNRPPLLHMGLLGSVAESTMPAGACPPVVVQPQAGFLCFRLLTFKEEVTGDFFLGSVRAK